jgi:uncharacterized protein YdaU (DUF1376 family)
MAKDPAFLFYASDFLTGVSDLSMEERGVFITLLCLQHQKGVLTKKMISLCGGNATADVMAKFRQDSGGNFYNERLVVEIEKRKEFSEKQRKRAKNGWEKRKNDATADATALPLENENINEIVNENTNKLIVPEICKTWYEIFPHYAKDKKEDYYAAGTILKFMLEQSSSNLQTEGINDLILLTVKKIAELIKEDKFWCDKPLKSISKNIQEFYNKLKNPQSNGKRVNLREAVQDEFSKRYG